MDCQSAYNNNLISIFHVLFFDISNQVINLTILNTYNKLNSFFSKTLNLEMLLFVYTIEL